MNGPQRNWRVQGEQAPSPALPDLPSVTLVKSNERTTKAAAMQNNISFEVLIRPYPVKLSYATFAPQFNAHQAHDGSLLWCLLFPSLFLADNCGVRLFAFIVADTPTEVWSLSQHIPQEILTRQLRRSSADILRAALWRMGALTKPTPCNT